MRKIYLIISILIACQTIEIIASDENDGDLDEVFRHEKRQEDDNELSEYSRRQMEGEPQLPSSPESSDQEPAEVTPAPPMASTRKSRSSSKSSRQKKTSSRIWGGNNQKAVDAVEGGKGDSGGELGRVKPMDAKAFGGGNGPQMSGMNDGPPMGGPGGPGGGPFGPRSGGPFGPGGAALSGLGGNQPLINQSGKSGTKKKIPWFG